MKTPALAMILLTASCGGAQARTEPLSPGSWRVCETFEQTTTCGTFAWNAEAHAFDARWENGATATVTFQRIGEDRIALDRTDSGGPFPGTRGTYSGERTTDGYRGSASITLPDGRTFAVTWEARGELPDASRASRPPPQSAAGEEPGSVAQAPAATTTQAPESAAAPTAAPTSAPSAVPTPAPAASSSCLLDAFLAFVGPDRRLFCDWPMTIESTDTATCTASATRYMGPAMGYQSIVLTLGPVSRPAGGGEDAPETAAVNRQGSAFRVGPDSCRSMTRGDFDRYVAEQESVDTSGPED